MGWIETICPFVVPLTLVPPDPGDALRKYTEASLSLYPLPGILSLASSISLEKQNSFIKN